MTAHGRRGRRTGIALTVGWMLTLLTVAPAAASHGTSEHGEPVHIEITLTLEGDVNPADAFGIVAFAQSPYTGASVCGPPNSDKPHSLPVCSETTYQIELDTTSEFDEGVSRTLRYGINRTASGTNNVVTVYENTIELRPGDVHLSLTYRYPGADAGTGTGPGTGTGTLPDTAVEGPPAGSPVPGVTAIGGVLVGLAAWIGCKRTGVASRVPGGAI